MINTGIHIYPLQLRWTREVRTGHLFAGCLRLPTGDHRSRKIRLGGPKEPVPMGP